MPATLKEKNKKISDKKLQEKIGFEPLKWQEDVLKSKSKEIVICCGRRSGKSLLVSYMALKQLLEPNSVVWIVAPNYLLTEIVFNNVIGFLVKIFNKNEYKIQNKPFKKLTLQNGSLLECKSVEAASGMLGHSTDLVIVDEAARVNSEIWTQYLEPTTQDRNGKAIFISTPTGLNWFYDKYMDLKPKGAAFNYPSKVNTVLFDDDKWEKLKKAKTQKDFEQEYEAKFISDAGQVFRNIDDIIEDYKFQEPEEGKGYIIGVDLAKHEDYTVCIVMDRISRRVVFIDRFKDIDYNIQKERIVTLTRKYNNAKVVMDGTGTGDPVVQDLKREIFIEDYRIYTNKAKEQLVDKLAIFIEQKLITIPNYEILIDELKRFGYKKNKDSNITKYSAPNHRHDDCVMALALCVWGIIGLKSEEDREPEREVFFNEYI